MRLTPRQKTFLSGFIDIYYEAQQPIHYTTVAENMGIGKITAYDMLRLLEERGLVRSEYVLRDKRQGAGRSSVFFCPTRSAEEMFVDLTSEGWNQTTWDKVASRLLDALKTTKNAQYNSLFENIVAQLPDSRSPMIYTAQMIVAVVLCTHQLRQTIPTERTLEILRNTGLPGRMGLSALAGLAVGLSFAEGINQHLMALLLSHIAEYQSIISRLHTENLERLSNFASEVINIVEAQLSRQKNHRMANPPHPQSSF